MHRTDRRLRILYLIDFLSYTGGAERFAVGLATHLPRDRFEPWFCSTREPDPTAERLLADAGIPHINLGRRAKWDVHRVLGLARVLREHRFDVLHTHKFGSNVWGTLIGSACRVPAIVAHEHSWEYEGFPHRVWLDRNVIARLATRFVAVSSADARRMVSVERIPPDKIVVIPTGYVASSGADAHNDVRRELGLEPGVPLIAIAAMLRPEKRLDVLIEAHARVVASVPGAHLVLAGDGECRAQLEQLATTLGLDGLVHFLGRRTDVDAILSATDVAALTSDREGSPLLVFECMASSTPLVATAVGGVPDLVEDGVTGLLVPRRNPEALAGAIVRLLRDPALRSTIGAAAHARLGLFTMDATAARFAELYESLVV